MSENPSRFLYITRANVEALLADLNVDITESGGIGEDGLRDLLDRAAGDLESDLVERFVVPLQAANGAYSGSPIYAKQKVLNAMKAKIRQIIGGDKQKNIVVESTERYIDLKKGEYTGHIKALVDHKRNFGFKLQEFANDTALQPVQFVGTARPSSQRSTSVTDEEEISF